MKTIDNFDLFKKILSFNSEDEFYFVQILIRGKDGHNEPGVNGNNKNRLIKFYTIKSINHLTQLELEIKSICKTLNARAYIHPTKRSFQEVANETLKITTDVYLSKNNLGLKNAYSSACGKSYITSDKKFIVDLDGDDVNCIEEISNFIDIRCEPFGIQKVLYTVPTAHGLHLITKPFNTAIFAQKFPEIDVHKNNPTLLYFICNDE